MDLKKQLPRIGEDGKDGWCEYAGFFFQRPDYEKFKKGVFRGELECVSVLIGIAYDGFFFRRPYYEKFKKGVCLEDEIFLSTLCEWLRTIPQDVFGGSTKNTHTSIEKGRGANQTIEKLADLFLEIKQMIDDGVDSGKTEATLFSIPPNDYFDGAIFDSGRRLHSLQFLSWAKKNGYPIPKELSFCTDKATGDLIWKESRAGKTNQDKLKEDPRFEPAIKLAVLFGVGRERRTDESRLSPKEARKIWGDGCRNLNIGDDQVGDYDFVFDLIRRDAAPAGGEEGEGLEDDFRFHNAVRLADSFGAECARENDSNSVDEKEAWEIWETCREKLKVKHGQGGGRDFSFVPAWQVLEKLELRRPYDKKKVRDKS